MIDSVLVSLIWLGGFFVGYGLCWLWISQMTDIVYTYYDLETHENVIVR